MRTMVLAALVAATAWAQVQVVAPQERLSRFEVSLQPVRVQVNGVFTQHLGTFGVLSWSPRKHVALQVLGGGNWYSAESAFNSELFEKFRIEAQAATSLLWTWGLFGAVELEPFLGELTFFHGPRVQLGFVVSVGAGAGGTHHQLGPTASGDTGVRFMGTAAAGLRLRVGQHFIARLEVRDVGYSATVDTVNGCTQWDLMVLNGRLRGPPRDPGDAPLVGPGCRGFSSPDDLPGALWLVQQPSSAILHNLGFAVGAGFTF